MFNLSKILASMKMGRACCNSDVDNPFFSVYIYIYIYIYIYYIIIHSTGGLFDKWCNMELEVFSFCTGDSIMKLVPMSYYEIFTYIWTGLTSRCIDYYS